MSDISGAVVCWLIDTYSAICYWLERFGLFILVWVLKLWMWMRTGLHASRQHQVIYARTGCGDDITTIICSYYKNDKVLSCFTLQRWLGRFDYNCPYVDIYFISSDNHIYGARINLVDDREIFTVQELASSDVDMANVPKIQLVEFLKSADCLEEHTTKENPTHVKND
jgi:hypothetical protein